MIVGATVSVGAVSTTTITGGLYQLNIQDVATDNTNVTVTGTSAGYSASSTFLLDIDDGIKLVNLALTTVSARLVFMNSGRLEFYNGTKELKFIAN